MVFLVLGCPPPGWVEKGSLRATTAELTLALRKNHAKAELFSQPLTGATRASFSSSTLTYTCVNHAQTNEKKRNLYWCHGRLFEPEANQQLREPPQK